MKLEKILIWVFVLFGILNEVVLGLSEVFGFWGYVVLTSGALGVLSLKGICQEFKVMVLVLLIIPLVRISELFLDVSFIWKVIVGYGILLFLSLYYLVKFDFDFDFVGNFERVWILPLVVVVAVLFGILGHFFVEGGGLVMIAVIPLIAFAENVFFRGLLQNVIEKMYGEFYSIFIPALLYGALSLTFGALFGVLAFGVGVALGLIYFFGRNLFFCVLFDLIFLGIVFLV